MDNSSRPHKTIPMITTPQFVPSQVCLNCEVCCRFPERHSHFRPFFTESEIQQAITLGIDGRYFPNFAGTQVDPIPNPHGEGYLCPAFDPETSHCRIYDVRPLDCQIYPFVVMWDEKRRTVHMGWDTKCPFLIDQHSSAEINQSTRMTASQSNDSPEALVRFIDTMAERIESPEMINILSANPQLVMEFQEDIVMVQKLSRLTKQIVSRVE